MVGGCFHLFDKLEFGGESPRTIRARCSGFRYCPNPLGIVSAEVLDNLANVCQMESYITQAAEQMGVTEGLKASNPIRWVRLMNNIKSLAEEIVLKEVVYK